jgi:hypothetical protein
VAAPQSVTHIHFHSHNTTFHLQQQFIININKEFDDAFQKMKIIVGERQRLRRFKSMIKAKVTVPETEQRFERYAEQLKLRRIEQLRKLRCLE